MISPTQYSSKRNSAVVLSSLDAMRFHPRFRDVTLVVGERRIPAQRCVLAAFSDYFRAMFEWAELAESAASEIRLEDVDADSVQRIVDFCYRSKIDVAEDNVEALLATACFLQVDEVKDYCCEFLELHTDAANCLDVRRLAQAFHCSNLVDATTKFIQYHFVDLVSHGGAFADCDDVEQLAEIVSLSNLRVESETGVFEAVMRWTRADPAARAASVHRLLRHVRLPLLDPATLAAIAADEALASNAQVADIVDDARRFLGLAKADRPRSKRWLCRPRHRGGKKCGVGRVNVAATASVTSAGELVPASDPHWTCYEFAQPIRIARVDFRWSCSAPLTITFESSNDAKHWKPLSRTTFDRGGYWRPHACQVAVPQLTRFYRLFFSPAFNKTNVDGEGERRWRIGVRDVKMFEAVQEKVESTLFQ